MENYEKAYKEALKVMEGLYNVVKYQSSSDALLTSQTIEKAFPELKESEDERIRKRLIEIAKIWKNGGHALGYSDEIDDILAWLEKQGTPAKLSEEERNGFAKGVRTSCAISFIDYLDAHRYEGKMCVSNGECEDIENAFHNAMWDRLHRYYCKYIEKQGEQKPTWSEEDEKCLVDATNFLYRAKNEYAQTARLEECITWLESIKPHWKPSEEQMEIIDMILTDESMDDNVARILRELKEQLEKL